MNSLEKHVLRIIGEDPDNPDVFSDITPVRNSINDAIQELCMVSGSYKRTYLLPLYEGRLFYRMGFEHDYFGWIVEAWDRSRGRKLSQTDILSISNGNPSWISQSGPADQYMQIGENIIGFDRAPTANGGVIELDCVCIPKPYTTDKNPIKVREVFQKAAIYAAVSEFYASRGNASRANEFLSTYLETAGEQALHPNYAERFYQLRGDGGNLRNRT